MRSIPKKIERTLTKGLVLALGAPAVLLLAGAVTSCRDPLAAPVPAAHPDDETPRRGGIVRLASYGAARALDPAVAADKLAAAIDEQIFAGLVDFDERGELYPDLAERWEVLDDGRTYRFTLRQGVRFHDGEELTAEDVKRSVERALHPDTPNAHASWYDDLVGFEAYRSGEAEHLEGVQVDGRYVVSFRIERPDATFLPRLGLQTLRPVCKGGGTRVDPNWIPCGAGPFKLASWDRATGVRLERFDGYFRPGLPHLDGISFAFSMHVMTGRFKFESGELDLIRDLNQADLALFQSDPRWRPYGRTLQDISVHGESMNTEMPPFDNVEVRRAVAAAIDREALRLLKPSNLTAATQAIPRDAPGFSPTLAGQRYDYAAALEHMRKAGYPYDPATGKGGYPKTIPYIVYQQGLAEFTAQIVKQQLAKIGLRIELRLVSWPAYLAATRRRNQAPMSPESWELDYPDPSNIFEPLFGSASINPEESNNTSFYSNPQLDALLERARRELDPGVRQRLYDEANAIVCSDAPWAFTHNYHWFEVRQPYLRGYRPNPYWPWHVGKAWLDRSPDATAVMGPPIRRTIERGLGARSAHAGARP